MNVDKTMQGDSRTNPPLLQVKNLGVSFRLGRSLVPVVQGVNFSLAKGGSLGVIGESGCGKTITSLALMRLLPQPLGQIHSGEVWLEGRELLSLPIAAFRPLRGKEISMIFQDPMTSLNPVLTIGQQLLEVLEIHQNLGRKEGLEKVEEMIQSVGIADAKKQISAYPHQLSGGMKQRIMIAMALALNPKVLIADEPTTALDVTIQAQILQLIKALQTKLGMSLIMITHDLGVVAQTCDDLLVMYAGQVVERGRTADLFARPRHPYTQGLMRSVLSMLDEEGQRLACIEGRVPDLEERGPGCPFANRCPRADQSCLAAMPPLLEAVPDHAVACFHQETRA